MEKYPLVCSIVLIIIHFSATRAQDIESFGRGDFDLRHNVERCLVSTPYGKEEYGFNEAGQLIKSITRYNETDYDASIINSTVWGSGKSARNDTGTIPLTKQRP